MKRTKSSRKTTLFFKDFVLTKGSTLIDRNRFSASAYKMILRFNAKKWIWEFS